ncbi:polynucleotide 3'-phosphatase ZDP isoform X2 [Sorghum bicolor]|nr:polynucleotide 3'-phosphatase ZDP isoform X2 [Sorghum bicolor]|eukprot:XP_021313432.1 polynucleotide 3'-phosphatase ZDP isoform X2 [Sorghum bicolor]
MLAVPFSCLRIARNPIRVRLLHPVSAARVTRLAMSTTPPLAAATISVEYAKSGRSTCKGCSGAIASGALRLGASARDPRGFDATKWYHVSCLPSLSHPLGPIESIKGFDSIKDHDREELRKLEKNHKRDNTAVSPLEEPSPKKARIQMSSPAEGVPDKVTISVEYAKSGRSTCKGCNENIAKGALRLGASFPDPRGYENNKWYHVACFPTSSYPLFPMENLKGFDSIKDHDRDKLRKLEENRKSDGNVADVLNESNLKKEMAQSMEDSKEGAEKDPEGIKNHKRDKTAGSPLEEPSPKKARISAEGVPDKVTISVEYAKSGRSTCKGCNENIAKGALRLGASFPDPRGYENNKWYHVACFPTSSYPLFPMENLKGFDSIEDHDRDKLRKLEENHKSGGNVADESNESNLKKEMAHNMKDSKGGADKDLEGVKVHCMGESGEGAENNLEEAKLPAGNRTVGPSISFSLSDIKKEYKDATLPAHWKVFDTVIFREQEDGLHASSKIAAFDFDGCLAKTSVRRIGADQWSLQHKSIPEKLQRLYNDGYKLVIFTNESNIERHKNKRQQAVDSKVGRLDNFIECVKAPIQVFIACGLGKGKDIPDDPYRKPNPGMWWLMAQHFNSGIEIDMDQSFYVGDAAGREKDHSDADIKFAKAIGLKFHVPEEYFP